MRKNAVEETPLRARDLEVPARGGDREPRGGLRDPGEGALQGINPVPASERAPERIRAFLGARRAGGPRLHFPFGLLVGGEGRELPQDPGERRPWRRGRGAGALRSFEAERRRTWEELLQAEASFECEARARALAEDSGRPLGGPGRADPAARWTTRRSQEATPVIPKALNPFPVPARGPARLSEEGASAITIALSLAALGGFLALVLNVGHLMTVRGQLQNATDSAAMAAALEIDGTLEGLDLARATASDYAQRHSTDRGQAVTIDPYADVEFGRWDWSQPKSAAFTVIPTSAPGAAGQINAVRVKAGREEARGNPLDVFFPAFSADKATASTTADSVAVMGAPCNDCSVPLTFADCAVLQNGQLTCGQTLVFRSDTTDNVGFTNLLDGVRSVNTSGIIDTLRNDCRSVAEGDEIGVSNGNNLNPNVVKAFRDYVARNGPQVTVPIVSPPNGCPAKFEGLLPVVGFATFTIVEVVGPPDQAIHIRLECNQTDEEATGRVGCSYFGTNAPRPVLAR